MRQEGCLLRFLLLPHLCCHPCRHPRVHPGCKPVSSIDVEFCLFVVVVVVFFWGGWLEGETFKVYHIILLKGTMSEEVSWILLNIDKTRILGLDHFLNIDRTGILRLDPTEYL